MIRAALSLTIILLCCGAVLAQAPQLPQQPELPAAPARPSDDQRLDNLNKPEPEQPKAAESWWQRIVRDAPSCKSFTDGCRTCSDSYVCSNIGIACQPKDWSCNDLSNAKPDAKPEARPDDKPKQ